MFDRLLIRAFAPGVAPPGSAVAGASLSLPHVRWLPVALLAWAAVVAGIAWSYRRVTARFPVLLTILRAAVLALLLLATLDPTVRLSLRSPDRRQVLVLIDDSASMSLADARPAAADRVRAALAVGTLDPVRGLDQPPPPGDARPSRTDLVRAALANPKLDLLRRLGRSGDVRLVSFGHGLTDLTTPAGLTAAGPSTPLGDAVAQLLARQRGQPTAAVVVVTDGQSNTGANPVAAARQPVPLLVWGVGVSDARDVIVSDLVAPDVAFVDDPVPVIVHVRGVGLAGQAGRVTLGLGDAGVDAADVTYTGGEQTVTLHARPTKPGAFDLSAAIAARPDEATTANNAAATRLRVIDGQLKVLLVDSAPRFEFKFLQAALLRDKRVSLHCVLQDADPGVSADVASPYLPAFPATRADLFDHTDLIVLGDIDPAALSAEQVAAITEFVGDFGGGLLVVPGRRFGLAGYVGSPLAKLLPIDPSSAKVSDGATVVELRRTPAGRASPTLRWDADAAASDTAWSSLPPVFTAVPADAKPAAEVLLADAANRAVLSVATYGRGQCMVVATDNTWRWRRTIGDRGYAALWGQIVQRLALPHLTGESRHARLATDRPTYTVGDRITLTAHVYGGGFAPLTDPTVTATLIAGGRPTSLPLSAVADEPGVYRAELVAAGAGSFTVHLDRDAAASADWAVTAGSRELSATGMDEPVLRAMAAASGGAFFREEDLLRLPDAVPPRADVGGAESTADVALWATPAYLVLLLALATAEWVLRKMVALR